MNMNAIEEVKRFERIWEGSKQVNPGKFNVILTLFLATVDPNIVNAVEMKIREKYSI